MDPAASDLLLRDVGARVAELRRSRGMTQAALAHRVGVSDKYLQRVEAGAENLTLRTLAFLAAALGVEVPSLFRVALPFERRRGRPRAPRAAEPPLAHARPTAETIHTTAVPLLTLEVRADLPDLLSDAGIADWVEIPGRRAETGLFVARIVGGSMAPRIPDGTLALFRAGDAASRHGAIALVAVAPDESGARYLLKRLNFIDCDPGEAAPGGAPDEPPLARVRLESLNPAHPALDVVLSDGGPVHIVAELVEVLTLPAAARVARG